MKKAGFSEVLSPKDFSYTYPSLSLSCLSLSLVCLSLYTLFPSPSLSIYVQYLIIIIMAGLQTPRVNSELLKAYVGRCVRLVGKVDTTNAANVGTVSLTASDGNPVLVHTQNASNYQVCFMH
jgi:Replication factor A protein 3